MSKPEHWDGPGVEAWSGAWTPQELASELDGVGVPWCVVGGWSIDLFLGEQTRAHEDIEMEVLRDDFPSVREHLRKLTFHLVGDGNVRPLQPGETTPADHHQNWGADAAAQLWRVDVMLEGGDADTWVSRRAGVSAPRSWMVGTSAEGIPFLQPQGTLLYKAKATLPKDEVDFAVALPRMDDAAKAWLVDALARAHPGHEWIAKVERSSN